MILSPFHGGFAKVYIRSGHGSGVLELTLSEFCFFSDLKQKFNLCKKLTWTGIFSFSVLAGVCVVFINVIT